jgi:hypothetical protein
MGVASPAVDEVFAVPLDRVGDFTFNQQVAGVFDDMVSRSVGGLVSPDAAAPIVGAAYR